MDHRRGLSARGIGKLAAKQRPLCCVFFFRPGKVQTDLPQQRAARHGIEHPVEQCLDILGRRQRVPRVNAEGGNQPRPGIGGAKRGDLAELLRPGRGEHNSPHRTAFREMKLSGKVLPKVAVNVGQGRKIAERKRFGQGRFSPRFGPAPAAGEDLRPILLIFFVIFGFFIPGE